MGRPLRWGEIDNNGAKWGGRESAEVGDQTSGEKGEDESRSDGHKRNLKVAATLSLKVLFFEFSVRDLRPPDVKQGV